MKAILIDKWLDVCFNLVHLWFIVNSVQGIDDITVSSVPIPIFQGDEILVKIEAAGVNFIDQLYV